MQLRRGKYKYFLGKIEDLTLFQISTNLGIIIYTKMEILNAFHTA